MSARHVASMSLVEFVRSLGFTGIAELSPWQIHILEAIETGSRVGFMSQQPSRKAWGYRMWQRYQREVIGGNRS